MVYIAVPLPARAIDLLNELSIPRSWSRQSGWSGDSPQMRRLHPVPAIRGKSVPIYLGGTVIRRVSWGCSRAGARCFSANDRDCRRRNLWCCQFGGHSCFATSPSVRTDFDKLADYQFVYCNSHSTFGRNLQGATRNQARLEPPARSSGAPIAMVGSPNCRSSS